MTVRDDINPEELLSYTLRSVNSKEEAMSVINGDLKDAFILKLSIDLQSKNGILLILISEIKKKILDIYSVVGTSTNIKKIRTFESMEQIFEDILKLLDYGGIETALSERVGRCIYRTLSGNAMESILFNIKKKHNSEISSVLEEALIVETKIKNTQVFIEVERVKSSDFYTYNTLRGIYPEVRNPLEDESKENKDKTEEVQQLSKTSVEQALDEIFLNYKRVVKCNAGISPARGVEFNKIKPNQPLYFHLPQFTEEEKNTAKELGGFSKNGKAIPVVGNFIKIIAGPKNEYHIFAKGPKGVLLHAQETHPVRISFPIEEEVIDTSSFK